MKVLFVLPTLSNGGAERVASILATSLASSNVVEIFTLEKIDMDTYGIEKKVILKAADVSVKRGNKILSRLSFITTFRRQRAALKKEIQEFKPDIIISFLPKADFLVYTLLDKRFRWISSERNDPSRRNVLERNILFYIYRKAMPLVCQTEKVASYYRAHGVGKTVVIKNPCVIRLSGEKQFPEDLDINCRYIISVGRLDRQKNFRMLIDAFSCIKNKSGYKLIILGTGSQKEELDEFIRMKGMQSHILLLGRKENVAMYLQYSEFFVLSSDYEGMPNALMEAMVAGLPVITTDFFTGAGSELIDKENGMVVPVADANGMQKAIETMIGLSEKERKQMGMSSRKKVERYSVENICKEWENLIHEVKR